MRLLCFLFTSLLFFSCKKSNESAIKLLSKEATGYNGKVFTTEYVYDSRNRIVAIKQAENNAPTAIAVSISYNGNEVTLISYPKYDPLYNITKEVHLMLDVNARLLKRIAYTRMASSQNNDSSAKRFIYDTLACEYDAAGFLKETKRDLYDTSWSAPGYSGAARATFSGSFTTVGGNLTTKDDDVAFTRTITNAGISTLSGGSSEYHTVFDNTKSYPNKTDFNDAAVLNESLDYYGELDYYGWMGYFEPLMDGHYKNMPEKTVIHHVDKDLSGIVYFDYTSTYEVARTYNPEGLLSAVDILTPGTPYTKLRYFYGR